jgi:exonuclease SbcC
VKLLRHEMAGFNNFTNPMALDFRELPTGVIAITGPNGAGKTSILLEGPMAGIYGPGRLSKAFPSREGALASYATSRKAYIDDLWQLGDLEFRLRVTVDGESRTTGAVLARAGSPLNDGKVTTYREKVDEIFPPQRSLLASAFSGQSRRGSFSELSQPDRVALFRELADLEHLETLSETAKRLAQEAEREFVLRRERLELLRGSDPRGRLAEAQREVEAAQSSLAAWCAEASRSSGLLEVASAAAVHWRGEAGRHAIASEQARQAAALMLERQAALLDAERDKSALQRRAAAEEEHRSRLQRSLDALKRRRQSAEDSKTRTLADLDERIRNNDQILASRDRLLVSAETHARLTDQRSTIRRGVIEARNALEASRVKASAAKSAETLALQDERRVKELRERAALIGQVKFAERCAEDPVCPLVADAASARSEAQAYDPHSLERAREAAAAAEAVRSLVAQRLASLEADLAGIEEQLSELADDINLAPHLAAAEERIKELKASVASAHARYNSEIATIADEAEAAAREFKSAEVAADKALRQAETEGKARISDALAALSKAREQHEQAIRETEATKQSAERLKEVEADEAKARSEYSQARVQIARLEAALEASDRLCRELAASVAALESVEASLEPAETEKMCWQTLAKALGRDGLQRLEIDAAGPVVSDLANQLLEVGYGPRFGVRIVTQVATADRKDLKEKLTIEVIDNAHGGQPRDIGDLSGGERVVVDEAVRAALACYVNLRSRIGCKTIWRDETTGALSPENVAPYVQMLRRLREISGADQVLFITHLPAAWELADAVVEIKDGQASIRRAD